MAWFRSYRTKLQTAFLALGLTSIGLTGWEASRGATAALRQATYDRLTAIRQTRFQQIERYFHDLGNHVLALSVDESTINAIESLRDTWKQLPLAVPAGKEEEALRKYYRETFAPTVASDPGGARQSEAWFPQDRRTQMLQFLFLADNPQPLGAKERLLHVPGPYGKVHARYHPTLDRYRSAFGIYDIFLIGANEGHVLYTVFKEIDLGVSLHEKPYRDTALAAVYREAMSLPEPEEYVLRDYAPYLPSQLAPAAFIAAPVRRAGIKIGVLAIQLSVNEVNSVMTADRQWQREGLGATGQSYIVGPDNTLRSDMRFRIEQPEQYFAQLASAGVAPEVVDDVRRHGTAVLRLRVRPEVAQLRHVAAGTEMGIDTRGIRVLRSHARLDVPGLDWMLVAEIDESEAFAPVRSLQRRILGLGALVAILFLAAAALLARSVTRPLLALADGARRLGSRNFDIRLKVESHDEIGQLAESFNHMAEDLERTTVSKAELEKLAGRLITAQEDERRRLARELHDDLSQRLAAVAIEAGSLEQSQDTDPGTRRSRLQRLKEHIAKIADEVHLLSRQLHPALLRDLGLVVAIESECRTFFERGGSPVDFEADGSFDSLSKDAQLALYRIVQESLQNIYKHAHADEIKIELRRVNDEVYMSVSDNGRGFDREAGEWRPGVGLASIEERARHLGGRVVVQSHRGAGTKVEVWVPFVQ